MSRNSLTNTRRWVVRLLSTAGALLTVGGAAVIVAASAMPWATAQLFGRLPVNIPGLLFVTGGFVAALGLSALIFRKSAPTCLLLSVAVIVLAQQALTSIPHFVRGELLGAQVAVSPMNELLSQFHIDTITVGDYGAKDNVFVGPGAPLALIGGEIVLVGSLLGLPRDPMIRRVVRQTVVEKCTSCGARWKLLRDIRYCPLCAAPTLLAFTTCRNCQAALEPADNYCTQCGSDSTRARFDDARAEL